MVRPQQDESTDVATIVDFGGPGSSLFGQDWPGESLQLIADTLHTNVVAFEEPWVNVGYPDGCRAAAAEWFRSLHEGMAPDGETFASVCDLKSGKWGWTPTTYNLAVQRALAAESLKLRAFVGASFAGVRLSYLADPPSTVILSSPYAITGTADGYFRSRIESTQRFCADGRTVTCERFETMPLDSRSLPATDFDVGAAWIASNYQLKPATARLVVRRGRANPELVGALSDAVTGRFGETDVSPSTFAYFSELCPRFTGWESAKTPEGLAGVFLRDWHRVCDEFDHRAALPPVLKHSSRLCVVVSREDGVVPMRVSRIAWARQADKFLVVPGAAHGVIDEATLNACQFTVSRN